MIGDAKNPIKISELTVLNLCRGKFLFLNPPKIMLPPCVPVVLPGNLVLLVRRFQGAPKHEP